MISFLKIHNDVFIAEGWSEKADQLQKQYKPNSVEKLGVEDSVVKIFAHPDAFKKTMREMIRMKKDGFFNGDPLAYRSPTQFIYDYDSAVKTMHGVKKYFVVPEKPPVFKNDGVSVYAAESFTYCKSLKGKVEWCIATDDKNYIHKYLKEYKFFVVIPSGYDPEGPYMIPIDRNTNEVVKKDNISVNKHNDTIEPRVVLNRYRIPEDVLKNYNFENLTEKEYKKNNIINGDPSIVIPKYIANNGIDKNIIEYTKHIFERWKDFANDATMRESLPPEVRKVTEWLLKNNNRTENILLSSIILAHGGMMSPSQVDRIAHRLRDEKELYKNISYAATVGVISSRYARLPDPSDDSEGFEVTNYMNDVRNAYENMQYMYIWLFPFVDQHLIGKLKEHEMLGLLRIVKLPAVWNILIDTEISEFKKGEKISRISTVSDAIRYAHQDIEIAKRNFDSAYSRLKDEYDSPRDFIEKMAYQITTSILPMGTPSKSSHEVMAHFAETHPEMRAIISRAVAENPKYGISFLKFPEFFDPKSYIEGLKNSYLIKNFYRHHANTRASVFTEISKNLDKFKPFLDPLFVWKCIKDADSENHFEELIDIIKWCSTNPEIRAMMMESFRNSGTSEYTTDGAVADVALAAFLKPKFAESASKYHTFKSNVFREAYDIVNGPGAYKKLVDGFPLTIQ